MGELDPKPDGIVDDELVSVIAVETPPAPVMFALIEVRLLEVLGAAIPVLNDPEGLLLPPLPRG